MAQRRWSKRVGPAEITKLSVGSMDNNVYLLVVGDDALLVDGSDEADAILSELGTKTLHTIVQTHTHGDHIQALPDLVSSTSPRVLVHPDDASKMPVEHETLAHGDTVEVGGVELNVRHTPGHTPGSICLILREAGETHLFSGDTLFPGGPGNTFGSSEAFETIMRSLDAELFVLPDDTHVYPGHGADTTIGTERPNLDEWRARGW